MTRKDYVKIAETLKLHFDTFPTTSREYLVKDMANMLSADNERFDRERFLRAAGVS